MKKSLLLFSIVFGLIGCKKNSSTLSPLPPTEQVKAAPKHMLYSEFPFERDYNSTPPDTGFELFCEDPQNWGDSRCNISLRSCPNAAPTIADLQPHTFSQNFQYTKGIEIEEIYPCYHGGQATSYSISPELPEGLVFSELSGRIAGTPTQLRLTPNTFTITATNEKGSTSRDITIMVLDKFPVISYSTNEFLLFKGGVPFSSTPQNTGGAAESWSISPSNLPSGFFFNTATGRISGVPNASFAKTEYTITASNSGGSRTGTYTITIEVQPSIDLIRAGSKHACAVVDQKAVCWGDNTYGQLGNGSTGGNSVIPALVSNSPTFITPDSLSLGAEYSCSLTDITTLDPTELMCWGRNQDQQLGPLISGNQNTPTLTSFTEVVFLSSSRSLYEDNSAYHHTSIIYDNGKVRSFGSFPNGDYSSSDYKVQVSGSDLSGIINLSAGGGHSCAYQINGTVLCWGDNSSGQLGDGSTISSLEPVANSKFNGSGVNTATKISSGFDFSCAEDSLEDIYCWGNNNSLQLGNSTAGSTSSSPVITENLPSGLILDISSGVNHTCAAIEGEVFCWGSNTFGQLGSGVISSSSLATQVLKQGDTGLVPLTDITSLSAGENFTCALTSSNEVFCWGQNDKNQLGHSSGTPQIPFAKKVENLF